MSIGVEITVTPIIHTEIDRHDGWLFCQDVVLESVLPPLCRVTADPGIDKRQIPGRKPCCQIQFDVAGILILLGNAVTEKQNAIIGFEKKIIRQNLSTITQTINTVLKPEDIVNGRKLVKEVYMDEKIERYILDIVFASRNPEDYKLSKIKSFISYGGSPRASINLAIAAKAYAFIKRRGYVIPEDVRAVCLDVMRHRVGLTYEAEAENITAENIITEILNTVEVP